MCGGNKMENSKRCPYCGSNAIITDSGNLKDVNCPACGKFKYEHFPVLYGRNIKNEIASFLCHKKLENPNKHYILNNSADESEDKDMIYPSVDEIRSFFPHKFADRISLILIALAHKSDFFGDSIELPIEELESILFIKRFDGRGNHLRQSKINSQYKQITEYLKENKYVDFDIIRNWRVKISLRADGWKRVDELQQSDLNNKNVFVSMAFNEGTEETRKAIKKGISDAGFSPELIDEIVHNQQIVPEMFRLIRESRFLILEISNPNYGAYYEAGYALGLGKEVIICCSKDIFEKDFGEDSKYRKPHFDIAQKQILIWDDYTDLQKKLSEWIKAIIG